MSLKFDYEKHKEYQRNYYQENKDKFKAFYEKNKELISQRSVKYKKEHPEKVQFYYQNNKNKDPEAYLKRRSEISAKYYDKIKDETVFCETCKKDISKKYFNAHSKTKKHSQLQPCENVNTKPKKQSQPKPCEIILPSSQENIIETKKIIIF